MSHTPGSLKFCGACVTQNEEGGIELDGEGKLAEINPTNIESTRRNEQESRLEKAENKKYRSIGGQLCFFGMIVSPPAGHS